MLTLAQFVNIGNTCEGKYFKLTDNINLSGVSYTAIGTASGFASEIQGNAFKGTFDGEGKTISNLTINKANEQFQGLFGYVDGATIQNLNVTGVNINGVTSLGEVVGRADNSAIDNVTTTGSISGSHSEGSGFVGGLVGWIQNSNVTNCKADVQVSGTNAHAFFGTADYAVSTQTTVSNCYYRGEQDGFAETTKIYKLTISDDLTTSGNFVEFGGNKYAVENTQVTLTINSDNSFHKGLKVFRKSRY